MKPRAKDCNIQTPGMSEGLRGQLYQVAVSMLLFARGAFRKFEDFQLETEVKKASVFDDVVFDEGNSNYRLMQLKHKTSKYKETIKGVELFQSKGDYCLLKYVCAWIRIQNEEQFKGKVKDAVVFTNISLDINCETNLVKLQHKQKDMKELFQNVENIRVHEVKLGTDDILQVKGKDNAKYYRFTDETVVDVLLRQINMLKITETKSDMTKILDSLSVATINDALEHIIYACNQPDEEGIFNIVHNEIREHFKLHSADTIFNKMKVHLTEWIKAKKMFNPVITYVEAKKFFERNVKSISFDLSPPISSFVGRQIELQLIREMFGTVNGKKCIKNVAIYGLGGVGKTQLAKMYVQMYKDEDYCGRVVWINAENNNTCERSFKDLAEKLGMTDSHKSIKTIISNIIDYFNDLKVLFVLDNVEKCQIVDNLYYLRSIIHTQEAPPHILITSRDRSVSNGMQHLDLNVLTMEEACQCITNQLNVSLKDAENLANSLQCFPLAIQQAIAFINQQNEALRVFKKRLTISDYLSMYHTKANKLLNYQVSDVFGVYSNTTLITWDMTIEVIRKEKNYGQEAINILQLLAFVPSENINPRMFLSLFSENAVINVANALHLLEKYSMISQNDGFLLIHRLVQKVMQLKITKDGLTQRLFDELIFILQHEFETSHLQIQITEHVVYQFLEQDTILLNYAKIEFPFGGSFIHYVARNGNVQALTSLLKERIDINMSNSKGETPLHLACFKAHFPAVKFLIENGADLFSHDIRGWTAVHRAAQGGSVQVLSYLIENGANLTVKDKIGRTVLHEAAMAGQTNMIKFLLTQKVDLASEANNGRTVLHAAAFAGDVDMVQFLLNEGSDLYCVDHTGRSALHSATFGGHTNMIRYLMEAGLDLNLRDYDGVSAIHEAAYNGDMEVVTFLLYNGANVSAKDNCGKTAMHEAALGGQIEMLEFFLNLGVNLDEPDKDGRTVFHMAGIAGDIDLLKFLLTKGMTLESTDLNGRTALHFAAANNNIDAISFFLDEGLDANLKDKDGKTVIHWGVESRHFEMIEYLIEAGVNLFERDMYGRTAVHWAAITTNIEMIEFLINKGLNFRQADSEGRTALHWASLRGCLDVIQFLLYKGLDVNSCDKLGRTPLDWANIGGAKEAVNFLTQYDRIAMNRRVKCEINKLIQQYPINI